MRKTARALIENAKASNGLRVGILGIGRSNEGVIDLLRRMGANFTLTLRSDFVPSGTSYPEASSVFFGKNALADINEDILFLSPSVRRDRSELIFAEERGVILSSDTELFFELFDGVTYAVTGSDGKSTTTYLISAILCESGVPATPCGNFGRSMCSVIGEGTTAVAELSSFQLSYCKPPSRRAVITSTAENHLNWHKNYAEYLSAKRNITECTEGVVVDADSEGARLIAGDVDAFCAVSSALEYSELRRLIKAENYITLEGGSVLLNGKEYFSILGAKKKESYNVKNYMMASGALIETTDRGSIERVLSSFHGLAHRAEFVRKIGKISYINSSIDSTPERTLKTLSALGCRAAVIIGGLGKGLSTDDLVKKLPTLTVGAAFVGEFGREVYERVSALDINYPARLCQDLEEATSAARDMLGGFGTVILSPAATSFDAYTNFEKRGEHFKRIVLEYRE